MIEESCALKLWFAAHSVLNGASFRNADLSEVDWENADQIFEKLDEVRMKNLLEHVCKKNNGQVFITDTHRERLEAALSEFDEEVQIIQLI